jgi:high-affinity iron transporter
LKSEVENAVKAGLKSENGAGKAIFLLVFIAVLREGFETVLFILAQFQKDWQLQTFGAIAGLSVATLLGILLFAGGVKINIRLFFQIMGTFLLLIVAGLLIGVLKHIDAGISLLSQIDPFYQSFCPSLPSSCLLGFQVWDGSQILSDRTFPGLLLKSLFGYRQNLYISQIVAYILFLLLIGGLYFQSLRQRPQTVISKQ